WFLERRADVAVAVEDTDEAHELQARVVVVRDLLDHLAHRPLGNLQGRAKGLEALTSRFTRRNGLDIGGLLGSLSGKQGLPVALTFQNGIARFGPFPLAELRPLY
ncbi:MAG TPA: hypothetical protein PLE50_11395, partial [Rhabdaerophilum sp.]|nr:hypothetical protein [Rhabdaerophilum sp.]